MKIGELAADLIKTYGDIEVVEMVHKDDMDAPEPYNFEAITRESLRKNHQLHLTELLTFIGHDKKKYYATANMRGYISGSIEKALLIDFRRYVDEED